ncbi:MAG: hypothetical protein WCP96_10530 [Methylococcaceae bacterium]
MKIDKATTLGKFSLIIDRISKKFKSSQNHIAIFKKKLTLKRELKQCTKKRIIVGAGGTQYEGWLSTDETILNLLFDEDWASLFRPDSLDAILAEHVWEHLTPEQAVIAASNCFKYLKLGGYLRVAVPDGLHPGEDYISWVMPEGIGPGSDDHKVLYTHKTFGSLFSSVGFTVSLLEYFDQRGFFHEFAWNPVDGMVRRSKRFDKRNADGVLRYTSIIIDAKKSQSADRTECASHIITYPIFNSLMPQHPKNFAGSRACTCESDK